MALSQYAQYIAGGFFGGVVSYFIYGLSSPRLKSWEKFANIFLGGLIAPFFAAVAYINIIRVSDGFGAALPSFFFTFLAF